MKKSIDVKLHNKFTIEVIRNGKVIDTGYAENIVLDSMYNRLCNFNSYFNSIQFGTGAGTPTPDRTSLFTHLGQKAPTTVEIIKSIPVSSVQKKITLQPDEYVGEVLSEVGIGFGSGTSELVTHALIKNGSGVPYTITKGALDVVVIYAKVYITFETNSNFIWTAIGVQGNSLVNYLCGSALSTSRNLFVDIGTNPKGLLLTGSYTSAAATPDPANKKISFYSRFMDTVGNYNKGIQSIGILGIVLFPLSQFIVTPHDLVDQTVGIGDGIKTQFPLPFDNATAVTAYVDGIEETDVIVTQVPNVNNKYCAIEDVGLEYISGDLSQFYSAQEDTSVVLKRNQSLTGVILTYIVSANEIHGNFRVYGRQENGDLTELDYFRLNQQNGLFTVDLGAIGCDSYPYIQISFDAYNGYCNMQLRFSAPTVSGLEFTNPPGTIDNESVGIGNGVDTDFILANTPSGNLVVYIDGVETTDYTLTVSTISFTTAPLTGEVITADYSVANPSITADFSLANVPKKDTHVLDTTVELNFAEGV